MKRNATLAFLCLFLVLTAVVVVRRVIFPLIELAAVVDWQFAIEASISRIVISVLAIAVFILPILKIARSQWSVLAYISSFLMALLAMLFIAVGIVEIVKAGTLAYVPLVTLGIAFSLLWAAWTSGSLLKSYKRSSEYNNEVLA